MVVGGGWGYAGIDLHIQGTRVPSKRIQPAKQKEPQLISADTLTTILPLLTDNPPPPQISLSMEASDAKSIRKAVWHGSIPVKIVLDFGESRVFDASDPYYACTPRSLDPPFANTPA